MAALMGLGVFFGGLGVFFAGAGAIWWVSIQDRQAKQRQADG